MKMDNLRRMEEIGHQGNSGDSTGNTPLSISYLFLLLLFLAFYSNFCIAQGVDIDPRKYNSPVVQSDLQNPRLVERFYKLNRQQLFWFSHSPASPLLRRSLAIEIDSAAYKGLEKTSYHENEMSADIERAFLPADSLEALSADMIFTDAAISFCKDIYCGRNISSLVNADEISENFSAQDNEYILNGLLNARPDNGLPAFIRSLEPSKREYQYLKAVLRDSLLAGRGKNNAILVNALNLRRWIDHFAFDRYIIVNIPSAYLQYYKQDSMVLGMKAVLGKISTKTPRFAAYCNQIILYPYWNVPRKIATRELLPLFKRFPRMVDSMNMQIIDNKGNIIDPLTLNWAQYNKDNFPFLVRQSTGCDNALGVVKFNLTSPYDVYMHDTNLKSAFLSNHRYYSHGCIRLEKPLALANYLLTNRLDSNYLLSCLKDQVPHIVQLEKPVPVFVVYINVEATESGSMQYYRDVYSLLR